MVSVSCRRLQISVKIVKCKNRIFVSAEAIRTTVVPTIILIRTTVVPPYPHDRRADNDSYPHDRNVTDDLCSLIKLCFAFIMVNFSP